MNGKTPIYWNGVVVGHTENINIDMFFWYGKWTPTANPETELFLEILSAGISLYVKLDACNLIVGETPAENIELKFNLVSSKQHLPMEREEWYCYK